MSARSAFLRADDSNRRRYLQFEALEARLAPAVLTVNSLADGPVNLTDTVVTLRDAIEAANADLKVSPGGVAGSGTDEIVFELGLVGTITLNQGQLGLRSDLTITGPGANLVAIDANSASRVFDVTDSTTTLRIVAISGLTITGGSSPTGGGAIINSEILTITGCTICENISGSSGGGIFNNDGGALTVLQSTICDNTANILGGGIYILYGGVLTVRQSTISGNRAASGGGISSFGDSWVNVQNSTISGNSAGSGGGIAALSENAWLTVQNSTISGNSATGSGGGIYCDASAATVQNSTITQNRADADENGTGSGGGIWFARFPLLLHSTIVSGNLAGSDDDDVFRFYNAAGVLAVGSYNLIGVDSGGLEAYAVNGNQVGVTEPGLGPLADNGGPTWTHALLVGSPAIDAGDPTEVPGTDGVPLFDQRGAPFDRVVEGYDSGVARIDIGAYERPTVVGLLPVVDTLADEFDDDFSAGHVSLREAIALAELIPGADTIHFASALTSVGAGTIQLTRGELNITSDLTIKGPGAKLLTIDQQTPGARVLNVDDGNSSNDKLVALTGLTLTGGQLLGTNDHGAGIRSRENLVLIDMSMHDNASSASGGGIWQNGGNLVIHDSNISENVARTGGGVSLTNSLLTIESTTISGNRATELAGGGLMFSLSSATINNSTISGNTAHTFGGGIFSFSPYLVIKHSTITGNQSVSGGGSASGGGLAVADYSNGATLEHVIVAGNYRGSIAVRDDVFVDSNSFGPLVAFYSLVGDKTGTVLVEAPVGAPDANGNLIGGPVNGAIDPLLGPLADNGGSTFTHALLPGSPAINAGNASFVSPPNYDQRGFAYNRVIGGRIDIGAFEWGAASADFDEDGDVDGRDFLLWQRGFGRQAPNAGKANGDADNDRDVDAADLVIWKEQYGTSPPLVVSLITDETPQPVALVTNNLESDLHAPVVLSLPTEVTDKPEEVPSSEPLVDWEEVHDGVFKDYAALLLTADNNELELNLASETEANDVDAGWLADELLESLFE